MNYRHAFHAGNFADVFKHLILARILIAMRRKETPLRVIDTHAGAGLYDLSGGAAARAGEWRDGIGRLDKERMSDAAEALAAPFRDAVAAARAAHGAAIYPGSPDLARRLTRPQDRLIFSEAHAETAALLKEALGRDRRAKILAQDGWMTLNAVIPPPERRGLVLIDPPFESPDEFAAMTRAFLAAWRKWPTGVYALWHPVKDLGVVERFVGAAADVAGDKALRAELHVGAVAARGLNACGMLIVNPPYGLEEELNILLPELARVLSRGAARWRNDRLAPGGARMPTDAPPRLSRRPAPARTGRRSGP